MPESGIQSSGSSVPKPPLSFAAIVKGSQSFHSVEPFEPEINYSTREGHHAVSLSPKDFEKGRAYLENVLILKFSTGRPALPEIRMQLSSWDLSGEFILGSIDIKHVLLRLASKEDVVKILSREKLQIRGYYFRVQKWTEDFNPKQDSAIAPVWMLLPDLPWTLYEPSLLKGILKKLGEVNRIDEASLALSSPNAARVSIQLDISKPLPVKLWVALPSGEKFWQPLSYDNPPKFCSNCRLQGHVDMECRKLNGKKTVTENSTSILPTLPDLLPEKEKEKEKDEDGFQLVQNRRKGKAKMIYIEKEKSQDLTVANGSGGKEVLIVSQSNNKPSSSVPNELNNVPVCLYGTKEAQSDEPLVVEKVGISSILEKGNDDGETGQESGSISAVGKGLITDFKLSKSAKKRLRKKNKQTGIELLVESAIHVRNQNFKQTKMLKSKAVLESSQVSEQVTGSVLKLDQKVPYIDLVNQNNFCVLSNIDEIPELDLQHSVSEVRSSSGEKKDAASDQVVGTLPKSDQNMVCMETTIGSVQLEEISKGYGFEEGQIAQNQSLSDSVGLLTGKLENSAISVAKNHDQNSPRNSIEELQAHFEGEREGPVQQQEKTSKMGLIEDEVKLDVSFVQSSNMAPKPALGNIAGSSLLGLDSNDLQKTSLINPWSKNNSLTSAVTYLVPTKTKDGSSSIPLRANNIDEYGRRMVPSEDDGFSEGDFNCEDDGSVYSTDDGVEEDERIISTLNLDGGSVIARRFPRKVVSSPHPVKVLRNFKGSKGVCLPRNFSFHN